MAIVERFMARLQIGGSNGRLASTSQAVGATDARAYIAAANQAARDATKVGLLLDSLIDMTLAEGSNYYKEWGLDSSFINDAFAYPAADADIYASNKFKVTYATTNASLPVIESVYISFRADDVEMESDGIHVVLEDGGKVANYVTQLLDTGISSYQTAITAVNSITVNDS